MTAEYPNYDSATITVDTLYCDMYANFGYAAKMDIFNQYCVTRPQKPILYINAGMFYFNITNTMNFNNIIFSGENALVNF